MPLAVVLPKSVTDIKNASLLRGRMGLKFCRGVLDSQNGQTVNNAIVLDNSTNRLYPLMRKISCTVEPGMVLDELNRLIKPYGLWFLLMCPPKPATIGGMLGIIQPVDVLFDTASCGIMWCL